MLTYSLTDENCPLYEALYRHIREDILSRRLRPGEKLPSKRALAVHLEVSKVTVEAAYGQLLAEGYIRAQEKVGYFVEALQESLPLPANQPLLIPPHAPTSYIADCTAGSIVSAFPFTVWAKLLREVMADYGAQLLQPLPPGGAAALRRAIAKNLYDFRSMSVSPEQILVGAGTDFLYNVLVQLLGRERHYAVENPGYGKIASIYRAAGAVCCPAPMDDEGILPEALENADVVHISPSHHFPTGVVTPIRRRQALLEWANAKPGRYLIEDDYDSEFRFTGRPIPTLQSIDQNGKVIYINTFSRTIGPAMRIGYLVLPEVLLGRFRENLGFYACTAPSFEQYTLARFLDEGYFEKHINRMRKFYRTQRNEIVHALESAGFAGRITILEKDAGLHFLLRVETEKSDDALINLCARAGIHIRCLADYYDGNAPSQTRRTLVVNYSGVSGENAKTAIANLEKLLLEET